MFAVAIFCITCLIIGIGLLLNGFIVIVSLFWWLKRETLPTVNVLITSIGLVRLVLLGVYIERVYFSISDWYLFQVDSYPEYTATFAISMIFCSLWWSSLLSVFYCVKITNYSNRLFIILKVKISKMVPWLLVISLVISLLTGLPCRWVVFSIHVVNGTTDGTMDVNVVNLFIISFAGSIVPFMICWVAMYLIIMSLLRHTRNMSSRDSGFSDAQRDIHLSVIRSTISLLLFGSLYLAAYIIFAVTIHLQIISSICFIFICAYPSLHSISLIVINKELKDTLFVVLSCAWLEHVTPQ